MPMRERELPADHDPFGPRDPGGHHREHPEAERARLYDYHRRAGSLGTYYDMYPTDRPWHWGLTAEERAAAEGRQGGRERER